MQKADQISCHTAPDVYVYRQGMGSKGATRHGRHNTDTLSASARSALKATIQNIQIKLSLALNDRRYDSDCVNVYVCAQRGCIQSTFLC